MAFTVELHRSPDNSTWTLLTSWTSPNGLLVDFITDAPGAGTWYYRMQVKSDNVYDVAGPRRLAMVAGNR